MLQLYVVRHGESELNARHIFAGQTDTPLNDVGRRQAQLAGEQARQFDFDIIVSSPLRRALETAQIIAGQIGFPLDKIIVNDSFQERSLGSLEGMSWEEVDERHVQATGMESWEDLILRAEGGLAFLRTIEADNVLLASHGSFIRALQEVLDPSQTHPEPENAQIVQLI